MTHDYKPSGGLVLATFVLLIPLGLFASWVHWVLWGWFAVPLGLPVLTVWQMYGARLVVNYALQASVREVKATDDTDYIGKVFVIPAIGGFLYLGIGWFVKAVLL